MRKAILAGVGLLLVLCACDRRRDLGASGMERRMNAAIPQIEEATGLKFKTPPKLEMRSRDQVREFLVLKFNEASPAEQLRGEEVAYKLFGMIPDTMDLRRYLLELLTEQIVGYYDPATKVLYVVEGSPSDLASITVTHELIHALQDQYVNLDSIQKATENSDRQAAAQAVLEGQATYEQMHITLGGNPMARLPGGWDRVRETIRESQTAMPIFSSAPMVIQESLLFPYLSGAEFVRRFEQRRGVAASPLENLPVSTEQILHEGSFFGDSADAPVTISLPGARDGMHEQTLGEFGTRLLIFQHLRNNTVAIDAATGWDGDRYRVLRMSTGGGIVWVSAWDSAVDAAQFVDALGQAIARRYRTGAARVGARGVRTYSGGGRTVQITPLEIDGRNLVMYVDVPAGSSTAVLNTSQISVGR